ncbi:solute carrier family 22 member 6-like [Carlito syrichta]|uniref:Solute carrier family 22 member 6-like n=1 Tax=Carlito syrichta TaxID=1868482 RepID=A0A3Q0DSI5_CARSF|nr:solute carrier family 22 member 6-like [Carlito syrichta]
MAFNDLLQQVGGVGRFQQIQVTLVVLPLLLMASHNTLQNFTAAVPTHHCRPPAHTNLSEHRGLEAWLPRDQQGRRESCLRFTSPKWGPPFPNGTEANGTGVTEPCINGWIYDNSTFPSTIVTEVRTLLQGPRRLCQGLKTARARVRLTADPENQAALDPRSEEKL